MRPYRKERVGSVVRDVVSQAISQKMHDPRLVPLTTVTRVEVTGDLQIARVYLSVHGGETAERKTMAAMQHAVGYLQRLVAGELNIRHCPELRFEIDKAVKNAQRTLELLEENRRLHPDLYESEDGADGKRNGDSGEPDRLDDHAGGKVEDAEE